jgi:hypothetical protein
MRTIVIEEHDFFPTSGKIALELAEKSKVKDGFDTGQKIVNPSLWGKIIKTGEGVPFHFKNRLALISRANACQFIYDGKKIAIINYEYVELLLSPKEQSANKAGSKK